RSVSACRTPRGPNAPSRRNRGSRPRSSSWSRVAPSPRRSSRDRRLPPRPRARAARHGSARPPARAATHPPRAARRPPPAVRLPTHRSRPYPLLRQDLEVPPRRIGPRHRQDVEDPFAFPEPLVGPLPRWGRDRRAPDHEPAGYPRMRPGRHEILAPRACLHLGPECPERLPAHVEAARPVGGVHPLLEDEPPPQLRPPHAMPPPTRSVR